MRICVLVAVMLLGFGNLAVSRSHDCAEPVVARMAPLNVAESETRTVSFIELRGGVRHASRVRVYEAWVELEQCRGNVVMKMPLHCDVRDIYTWGACKFAGLISYR